MDETLTAQEYIVWCVQTMTLLDDGPEFDRINGPFMELVECLEHLHTCYDLPPHEAESRD